VKLSAKIHHGSKMDEPVWKNAEKDLIQAASEAAVNKIRIFS